MSTCSSPNKNNISVIFSILGDGWLLASIGAVVCSKNDGCPRKIADLPNFDLTKTGTGAVCFDIWMSGKWEKVIIDDRLPVIDDQLIFAGTRNDSFWVALMEKAFAKYVQPPRVIVASRIYSFIVNNRQTSYI